MEDGDFIEGCPLDAVLGFFGKAWTAHILWRLGQEGEMRFTRLRRAMPGAVSARVLSARLKTLEGMGLVRRADSGSFPLKVSYSLTEDGSLLHRIMLDFQDRLRNTKLPPALVQRDKRAGRPRRRAAR